jgi:S-DNA-T family DNA segregation ATPase FtsK/SpoIIIE
MDFTMLGVPTDVFTEASPPGRGYMDDSEVQVGVLGGDASVAKQAAELAKLVRAMERAGVPVAPPVERLPERVPLSSFGLQPGDQPVIGMQDEGLSALPFDPSGVFLVTGPAQSGRTSTLATIVAALVATDPSVQLVLLGQRRSSLTSIAPWTRVALTVDDIEVAARELTEALREERMTPGRLVVVVEGVADVHASAAGDAVQELTKACREVDAFVVLEGESSTLSGWDMQWARSGKYGVALQPEEDDGETLFGTPFPRSRRADFPVGRGYFIKSGRVSRVQVAMPE